MNVIPLWRYVSRKAKVFPASTLHKTNTAWVMAFEMVETSQVYLRTLAKLILNGFY